MSATSPTQEEAVNAKRIKVLSISEGLTPLTDFEYLQHAIVAKEDTKKAICRIRRLQAFREKYGIRDSQQTDILQLLKQYDDLLPDYFLGVGFDSSGRATLMIRNKNFHPKAMQSKEDWNVLMTSLFYLFNAMNHDLDAVRAGISVIIDGKDLSWRNFNLRVEKCMAEFYQDSYPIRMKSVALLDAPIILYAMVSLVKVFLSKKMKEAIHLDSSEKFFTTNQVEVPRSVIPERFGGTASFEFKYQFLEEHLRKRSINETKIKLD